MGTRRTRLTTIRLDLRLADEAKRALGVKSRTEAVHRALEEVVHLDHFKRVMLKYGGKLKFEGYID
ncbi:MAG: type II toxin-antitoxin system VapB family antitoxin [candidate division NC10 bacterium]|nr:type II toxin-antitoxin system VapB family antitoxin [candidate division NC10 bacterium]